MSRVKTFVNGGDIFPADLNDMQDDYEHAFTAWAPLAIADFVITGGVGAATIEGETRAFKPVTLAPADLSVGPRAAKLRVVLDGFFNNVAPAADFTLSLYALTAFTGTTPTTWSTSLGTLRASAVLTAPAAATGTRATSATITMPSGLHVMVLSASGAWAANTKGIVRAELQHQLV